MKAAGLITLVYGLLVLVGGIIGHVKAGSQASLIMGVICGALLIYSSIGMLKKRLFSTYMGLILILGLDAFFTYRWMSTLSFFPAGMMTLFSLAALGSNLFFIRRQLNTQKK